MRTTLALRTLFVAALAAGGANAQTAPAADPAAEALLKRYQSASDPREAQRAFDEIRTAGGKSPRAAYLCGLLAAQGGTPVADRKVAMQCFESAAQRGVPEAQHRLALMLLENKDDAAQRAQAEKLLASAAQSMQESVYALALLRADRQPDPDAARRGVVEKAAAMGFAPAQYAQARVLYGKETPQDRA